jgi:hypothetical protein
MPADAAWLLMPDHDGIAQSRRQAAREWGEQWSSEALGDTERKAAARLVQTPGRIARTGF